MSLEAGAKRPLRRLLSEAIDKLVVEVWECGNRAAISTFPQSTCLPVSCAASPLEAGKQFPFGRLHLYGSGEVGLGLRLPIQFLDRETGLEVSGNSRQLPQDFPGRGVPAVHSLHLALFPGFQ